MKKLRSIDEYGRGKAQERYGKPSPQSKHGQTGMSQNLRGKFQFADGGPVEGTDAYYAEQERKMNVPESQRGYGDPEPIKDKDKDEGSWSAGTSFLSRTAPRSVRKLFGGK